MKRVLITGAAGFLGSHLSKRYLDDGWHVIGIDDFSSSNQKSVHLRDLQAHEQFVFYNADITDNDFRTRFLHQHHIDLILNFACPASPPMYQSMPLHTMMTCTQGTMNMLELASDHGAVFVQASTSEVYGDPDHTPQSETYRGCVNSYGPRSCYDEGKRAAEALCYDFRHMYHVDARLVRIFNTFGENMDPYDGRVVTNFIRQALRKEKLTVYGDGSQGRSFCYVSDLIDGIVKLAALKNNPETPINLGNPDEWPIKMFAEKVLGCVNYPGEPIVGERHQELQSQIIYLPLPIDDPKQRCPNIDVARKILGWEPKVGITQGLSRTIDYLRKCHI